MTESGFDRDTVRQMIGRTLPPDLDLADLSPEASLKTVVASDTPFAALHEPGPAGTQRAAFDSRYQILSELGRGGMGIVYRSVQSAARRRAPRES